MELNSVELDGRLNRWCGGNPARARATAAAAAARAGTCNVQHRSSAQSVSDQCSANLPAGKNKPKMRGCHISELYQTSTGKSSPQGDRRWKEGGRGSEQTWRSSESSPRPLRSPFRRLGTARAGARRKPGRSRIPPRSNQHWTETDCPERCRRGTGSAAF